MFGHLGIEWNLLAATDDELAAVERIVSMHKAHRALLHGGRTVRIDVEDEAVSAFVVVAPDQDEAIVSVSQIATSRGLPVGPIRIPGLDLDGTYWLEQLALDERRLGLAKQQPAWLEGVEISGRQLAVAGCRCRYSIRRRRSCSICSVAEVDSAGLGGARHPVTIPGDPAIDRPQAS